MQNIDHALRILDELLLQAQKMDFSYVAIKSKTIADIMQKEANAPHHAMPTACNALEIRFRNGKDYFRRGKDRNFWSSQIDGAETSTFEVLFEINR